MWDFFIAYSSPDRAAADALYRRLTQSRARVFLDTRALAPGAVWGLELKAALASSRFTIVLVSRHTRRAWYQQEEVAIAISLVRQKGTAHRVVPVLLQGGRLRDVPYGLTRLTLVREDELGLNGIVRALLANLKHARQTPGTTMLGRSAAILDELWSDMEPVLQDKQRRVPQEYRIRFTTEGSDLVLRERGTERVRITRGQFKRRLTPSQFEYVETLERSMEVNLAFWKREYPRRSLNRTSKARVKRAVAAMAQDLEGVLTMLETAGFWLDDHYLSVRQIVNDTLPRAGRGR